MIAKMIAKMIAMSERSLETVAPKGDLRARLIPVADGLVAAVAVSLPWSTSATGILIVLWLIALVPTLDGACVRRELLSLAGGLPVLLWALGAIGMLWADVSWSERIAGLSGFHKLLVIPLLLAQFRRSEQVQWVIVGLLASCGLLLIVSWALVLTPGLMWRGKTPGVPVKDYISQSSLFVLCAFGLIDRAIELWRSRQRQALVLVVAAGLFIANIGYVATGRTTLVVAAVLLLLLGMRRAGWKGVLGALLIGAVLAGTIWASSPYLRERLSHAVEDVSTYDTSNVNTSAGLRLEYWKKSFTFVTEAPIFGHGTGTIPSLFRRDTTEQTIPTLLTSNPHNQALTVAIQLGLLGAIALIAMWVAHIALFRDRTLFAWLGLVVAVQNVIGSLLNSYLFDFGQGWLYVLGVGIIGGTMLRVAASDAGSKG
jgi:O-antigen ligase